MSFPIPFPNRAFSVVASVHHATATSGNNSVYVGNITRHSFRMQNDANDAKRGHSNKWLAIGF